MKTSGAVVDEEESEEIDAEDDSFLARLKRMDCGPELEQLVIDILESPLRQRNSLLVIPRSGFGP